MIQTYAYVGIYKVDDPSVNLIIDLVLKSKSDHKFEWKLSESDPCLKQVLAKNVA